MKTWCISDGSAAKLYDGEFQDPGRCDEVENETFVDELIHRTPGYSGWQQEYWLSHCGDYCAIVQYVGWKEISHLEAELDNDINSICNDYRMTREDFKNWLVNNGSLQGYLFKCLHCGKHRLCVDAS